MSATQPKRARPRKATGKEALPSMGSNYERIRDIVLNWPLAMRYSLIRDILDMLAKQEAQYRPSPSASARNTLDRALGLARTDQPPPSDEEVRRWLDERRTAKYG